MRDIALGCQVAIIVFAICIWRFDFWDGGSGNVLLHGFLIALVAGFGALKLIDKLTDPDPIIPLEYKDDVIKFGVLACFSLGFDRLYNW